MSGVRTPVESLRVRRARGGAAVVALAIAAAVVPVPAAWVEAWYSRGAYLTVQNVVTSVTNASPIALLDIALVLLALVAIAGFRRRWKRDGPATAAIRGLASLALLAAIAYLWFLALWGLNYRRLPLETKIEFDAARITPGAARQLGELAVTHLNGYREQRLAMAGAKPLEHAFAEAQAMLGHAPAVPGVPKKSLLGFYFRTAAIDGMTDPWFLEIIVNDDVLPFERPFVTAHEWAHLAGYAHEAEANFVSFMTCMQGDAAQRYSAWLAVYEHVWSVLPRRDRGELAARLAEEPRNDLRAMAARYEKSTPVVRNAARDVYDGYLRANRVKEGIASYTGVVRLLLGAGVAEGRERPAIAR
jgi:hypothetical protein